MIVMQTVIDFLQEYGKLHIHGNNINMRCMLCGDSKKSKSKRRFWAKCDNGISYYNCYNCGASGTIAELYSQLKGVPLHTAISKLESPDFNNVKMLLTKQPVITETKPDMNSLDYVYDYAIFKDTETDGLIQSKYKEYLLNFIDSRGIPEEYEVFIVYDGDYKGRIIVPIYIENRLMYFQGRAIHKDMEPKYMNPQVDKTGIIMNIDRFNKDKYIIVTEGIIDAMMIENNQGTAVIGGSVSDDFLSILYKNTDIGVIIAVDNDKRGEIERDKLSTSSIYRNKLKFFTTPRDIKDINEFVLKSGIDNVYNYIVENSQNAWSLKLSKVFK